MKTPPIDPRIAALSAQYNSALAGMDTQQLAKELTSGALRNQLSNTLRVQGGTDRTVQQNSVLVNQAQTSLLNTMWPVVYKNPQTAALAEQLKVSGQGSGLSGFLNKYGGTLATLAATALAGPALYGAAMGGAGAAGAGGASGAGASGAGLSGGATAISPDVASFLASTPVQAGASAGNAMAGMGYALPAGGTATAGMGNMLGAASLGNTASFSMPALNSAGGMVGTSLAPAAAGGLGGGTMASGSLFGDILGAVAGPAISGLLGSSAANTQASAAMQAAGISGAAADRATALQSQQWQQQQANQAPWLQAGTNALAQLSSGTQGPGAAFMKPFSMADYQADPGYAFRMKEGMKGLEQGAAARGGVLSGNMLRGAQQYGQDMASQEYQNAFNRYQTNQGNQFNRLSSMAGLGQTAVSQLGQAGQTYAGNVGNIGMGSAANQGNAAMMAGNARASSLSGIGNALGSVNWGGMFNPQQQTQSTYGF